MSDDASNRSSAAHHAGTLGAAALACVVLGVGGAWLHVLPPFGGFALMVLGAAVGLAGTVTALVGVRATRPHLQVAGRGRALQGLAMSLATVLLVLLPATKVGDLPRINDISTDLDDPPVFLSQATLDANRSRDMGYPGSEFARQQAAAYPDLASLVLDEPVASAFDRVRAALASMERVEIVDEDRAAGRLEAVQTSALFHFADDIVVRVRPFEGGSRVDVRSKSRDGKGDMGVNAARIRDLFARVRASAPAPSDAGQEAEPAAAPAAPGH